MSANAIELRGLNELMKRLEVFPQKLQNKIERTALRKALVPALHAAEARVPVGETGNLAGSGVIQTRNRKGYLSARVVFTAPHAHLLEFGHRLITRGGIRRQIGFVAPRPFLRPALDETAETAVQILADEVEKGLVVAEVKAGV